MVKNVKASSGAKTHIRRELDRPSNEQETVTTAIHIPKRTWELLRAVAFHRAQTKAERVSVSKLIAELVEERRSELERESR